MCYNWAHNCFTSAMSSSMVLIHSTTLSALPPTSTTRSVDWGQHSWKSLMVVWVLWNNNRPKEWEEKEKKNLWELQGTAYKTNTQTRYSFLPRLSFSSLRKLYSLQEIFTVWSSPHAALWFWPPSHRWCCLPNSDGSAAATRNQSPPLCDADTNQKNKVNSTLRWHSSK